MFSRWPILALTVGCLHSTPSTTTVQPSPALIDATSDEDMAWAQSLNNPDHPPPSSFRTGHVSQRTLPDDAIRTHDGGFEIQLPSGAPITTPAIHQGLLLTSGGFQGKEFYAFNATTGELHWALNLDDDGPSAPACADGICVFNTESCTVFAIAAQTGELLWSWWMGDPMLAAPAIDNGIVFTSYPAVSAVMQQSAVPFGAQNPHFVTHSADNQSNSLSSKGTADTTDKHPDASHVLAALNLQTGEILWQRWIDGDVISAPVAVDEEVHVTTFSGSLFTFSQAQGEIRHVERGRATSAPTIAANNVYWSQRSEGDGQNARESLVGADRDTRRKNYLAAEQAAPYLDSAVQSSSRYNSRGAHLDASNGFVGGAPANAKAERAMGIVGQRTVSRLQAFQGSRISHANGVNFSTMGHTVIATHAESGDEIWRHEIGGDIASEGGYLATSPALASDSLVVGTIGGKILVLESGTGAVEHSFQAPAPIRSQPVVSDGWVYVGTEDGRIVAINTQQPELTGWPMWGGNPERTATKLTRNGVR